MIQIKTFFNGWKEVNEETALKFATHLYKGMTSSNRLDYINAKRLKGIAFSEEQIIEEINKCAIY